MAVSPEQGVKNDDGKAPWDLLPFDAVEQIVKVLQHGAKKYAARNWEKGLMLSRPFAAMLRHLTAWWRGTDTDEESGLPHLAHAGCCLLFLLAFTTRGRTDLDDRPAVAARRQSGKSPRSDTDEVLLKWQIGRLAVWDTLDEHVQRVVLEDIRAMLERALTW